MTIYTGTVLAYRLNVRNAPNTGGVVWNTLQQNDVVTANEKVSGWWRLTSITRNGQAIALPIGDWYSYEGDTNGFIRQDSAVEEPPSGETFMVEIYDGETLVGSEEVDALSVNGTLDGDAVLEYTAP